jgi:hypothetical protein
MLTAIIESNYLREESLIIANVRKIEISNSDIEYLEKLLR